MEQKKNLGHFRPFLSLVVLKAQHFFQKQVSRAKNSIILYDESEKNNPEMICIRNHALCWARDYGKKFLLQFSHFYS
jgi:hypothetical protein